MPSLIFRELDGNQSIEIPLEGIQPFNISELLYPEEEPFTLKSRSKNVLFCGETQAGYQTIEAKVLFSKPTTIYTLVRGGWLPMPIAHPQRFLVDKNVIIDLCRIRQGKVDNNASSLQFWISFFKHGDATFSPLPYAYEASSRRKPSMDEFKSAYTDGVDELRQAIPNCNVIEFTEFEYSAAYNLLENRDNRNECETLFLQDACPKIAHRCSRKNDWELARQIVISADQYNVSRTSLVNITVLSCLFENVQGVPTSIGREILKPKRIYSREDAFNALNDLRHIEIAFASQVCFRDKFFLCTRDKPLAMLWSALSLDGNLTSSNSIDYSCNLTRILFSRLNDGELNRLGQLIG